ncbi:DNA damage-inducible protein 1 [Bienertia sinuspersici]
MQTRRTGSHNLIPIDPEIEASTRKKGSKRRQNKNKKREAMAEQPTKSLWEMVCRTQQLEHFLALSHKLDQLQTGSSMVASCDVCGVQGHPTSNCQFNNSGMSIEQANSLYNTNQKRQFDPYSNTYNEGWKHNPAFSYKNTQNQLNPPIPPRANPPPFNNNPPVFKNFISTTNNSIQRLEAQNKLMENQISQLAQQLGQSSKAPGQFPGNTEQPPKDHINAVTLRSGKELEDPSLREAPKQVAEEIIEPKKVTEMGCDKEEVNEHDATPIEPYKPPVPYPQRLAQAKLEKKYGKFLDILKKLHINIPFLDAISKMPSYAKFLKDMLSNKRKIEVHATVSLTVECSAILQNKLPQKLGDPGSYSIPVKLGDIEIKKALCDLGASVSLMPLSICKKLQMGELKPTHISLQLADRTVKFPLGILEDVPLRVGKFFIPCDFVVMEMEEDAQVPIILGRPFLATAGAIIDMKNGKITFEVGTKKIEYNLMNSMEAPSMGETIYRVDALDEMTKVKATKASHDDPLEKLLVEDVIDDDMESLNYKKILDEAPILENPHFEVLNVEEYKESPTPPEVELKPSPLL